MFCPNSKVGGHDSILRTILRYLCITGTMPLPPKYAPDHEVTLQEGGVGKKLGTIQGNVVVE